MRYRIFSLSQLQLKFIPPGLGRGGRLGVCLLRISCEKMKRNKSLALMNLMAKECLDLIVHSLDRTKFLHTDFFLALPEILG